MSLSIYVILTTTLFVALTIIVRGQWKGIMALLSLLVNGILSSVVAVKAVAGQAFLETFHGGLVFGEIAVNADALSGWFILLMNFTVFTGILYGRGYMKHYQNQSNNLTLHFTSYIIIHFAMIGIYCVQNTLVFLCVWELMAITSFFLIIFEHHRIEVLKAGINYIIQAHIGIAFLMIGFIWVGSHTGSFDFKSIGLYSASVKPAMSFLLFLCFLVPFAIKAGFVPFHTWLPHAHPAAPSHISGVMSGVIIKLGIFGILRMLLLIKENYVQIGYTILVISVISGIYGVVLAIVQHNVKKLLAYHSIENIGIIGIGIGIGTIGLGLNNYYLSFAGFAGAMLHTLNHSLFKSLLFYGAGTIYQATHIMDIEKLGGLVKKMPQTAVLFLIAALAICGLPPFNGFISEFLIYSGLFGSFSSANMSLTLMMLFTIFGLVLIGGLALLCFTKAFGIIFLGRERHPHQHPVNDPGFKMLFPKYLIAAAILIIGVVPQLFVGVLSNPVGLLIGELTPPLNAGQGSLGFVDMMQKVSLAVWGLILLSIVVYFVRKKMTATRSVAIEPTWGCGYTASSPKLQYTANSFVRSYRKLAGPILMMNKKESEVSGIFPEPVHSSTHPFDKLEAFLIITPIKHLKGFLGKFGFLQNGNPQFYILYGAVFILSIIIIPMFLEGIFYLIELFSQI